ncbi:hydroxymethylbilane synthase [Brachybacterium sp. EF45031]|uniref:hydroxymethylbilane synthase n=1 Tax=Brachybacterium sillae TaxID=2810536 RepID=UPI00217D8BC9|nr:hydroxymethylbilane synthase [Brachybacterium sillae]MCS6712089.1 hydroxymethylbilane synthase [Brachybacterium sillae]
MTRRLRLGTRASALALAQSGTVGAAVVDGDGDLELVHVHSHGDVDRTSPLTRIGGTGVFVTAVRQALLDGEVDLIVHSCKDLPTAPADGIALAAVPAREDVRDVLCGSTLEELTPGARVGTGSPRRAAQLLRHRPDLQVVGIRGNIDTRLARAIGPDADLDAVVLAAAGLRRLGREDAIAEALDPTVMLPAPAQGALAVECRTEDLTSWFGRRLAELDDPAARAEVTAERTLLRTLEAGCAAPVAALARAGADGTLTLQARVGDGRTLLEGERALPRSLTGGASDEESAIRLGAELAQELLERGAADLIAGAAEDLLR